MRQPRSLGLGLWVIGMALGCGDATAPLDRDLNSAGDHGGLRSPCDGEPVATPVAWDEQTALAISARDAFAPAAGRCEAPFSWDASGAGVALEPVSGAGALIVRVTVDESSARLVRPQPRAPLIDCAPFLEVDAHVALESEDGTFADSADVTLLYREDSGVTALSFSRAPSQLGGSLRIRAEPGQDVSIQYRVSGGGDACAGEIAISTSTVRGNMGSGSIGTIGRWSNTGCALGEEPLRLDGSSVRGANIVAAVEDAFGEASYSGAWEDGVAGDLELSLEIDAAAACAQRGGHGIIAVPVQLAYGTSDGRVEVHTADAHVNVWTSGDEVSELGLVLSETMACSSDGASLAYTGESCETLSGVEAQISFNYYLSGSGTSGGRLEVYKYRGKDRTGAADGVDRWVSE